jgi:hypothetical protein
MLSSIQKYIQKFKIHLLMVLFAILSLTLMVLYFNALGEIEQLKKEITKNGILP